MKTGTDTPLEAPTKSIWADFAQLTKMRLAFSVVFSSFAGYLLAAEGLDTKIIALLVVGGYAMVGASNAFNQIIETDLDAIMQRTRNRPLPTARVSKQQAFWLATVLSVVGIYSLYLINFKTAFFGGLSLFIYVALYTPLKTKTPLAVFVGAFPGAIPYMLGWVAATGQFGIEPGILFMVQFFWQFPHFWAIGWQLDADYRKAGFRMLPSGSPDQATAFQIVFYTLWTILISLMPYTHYTGALSLSAIGATTTFITGLGLLFFSLRLMYQKTNAAARMLTFASIGYITLVQLIYLFDKFLMQ